MAAQIWINTNLGIEQIATMNGEEVFKDHSIFLISSLHLYILQHQDQLQKQRTQIATMHFSTTMIFAIAAFTSMASAYCSNYNVRLTHPFIYLLEWRCALIRITGLSRYSGSLASLAHFIAWSKRWACIILP